MLPNDQQSLDLPVPVHILAGVVSYTDKTEYGLKAYLSGESPWLDVPKRKLYQAVKRVKYDWLAKEM